MITGKKSHEKSYEIQVCPQPNSATALQDVTPPELQLQIKMNVTTAWLKAAPVECQALLHLLQPDRSRNHPVSHEPSTVTNLTFGSATHLQLPDVTSTATFTRTSSTHLDPCKGFKLSEHIALLRSFRCFTCKASGRATNTQWANILM